jgi:hypothetical protein
LAGISAETSLRIDDGGSRAGHSKGSTGDHFAGVTRPGARWIIVPANVSTSFELALQGG